MRVRCLRIIDAIDGKVETDSAWLRVGREYTVLAISAFGGRVLLRIASDEAGVPALFQAEMFEVVDSRLPSSWRATLEQSGGLDIGPDAWLQAGFWEDYFNDAPEAVAIYERERAAIEAAP